MEIKPLNFYTIRTPKVGLFLGLIAGLAYKYKINVIFLRVLFLLLCIPIPVLIILYFVFAIYLPTKEVSWREFHDRFTK